MHSKGWAGPVLPITRNSANEKSPVHSVEVPRNLTGIYVGYNGSPKIESPRQSIGIPPLVRGRGRRFRTRTPTEQRRDKMVEVLRLKEDKRGFGGIPLRRKVLHSAEPALSRDGHKCRNGRDHYYDIPQSSRNVRSKSLHCTSTSLNANQDFIRMNPRQYTATMNSGITHYEYLMGRKDRQSLSHLNDTQLLTMDSPYNGTVLEEMIGMQDCYQNICKGRLDTLSALSPGGRHRRVDTRDSQGYTGFTIRSYQNPPLIELMPDFERTLQRSASNVSIKLHTPEQYYFPRCIKTPDIRSAHWRKSNLQTTSSPVFSQRSILISGINGSGDSPSRRAVRTSPERKPIKTFLPNSKAECADIKKAWTSTTVNSPKTKKETISPVVSRSMPPEEHNFVTDKKVTSKSQEIPLSTKIDQFNTSPVTIMENSNCDVKVKVTKPTLAANKDDIPPPEPKSPRELSPMPPSGPIMISLDNAEGESKIVDIDAEDSVATGCSLAASREDLRDDQENKENVDEGSSVDPEGREIKTLTKKSLSSEAIVASLKENAEQRQKDFEKLLDEHAVLVQEITRASSSDNLTQENTRE